MTPEERAGLLADYHALAARRDDPAVTRQRSALRAQYEAALPRLPLARCPFTGEVLVQSLDTGGLDGLWWDYDLPIRAVDEERPGTFVAVTGALHPAGPVEPAPFDRMPGPEAPFVVPRMLLHPDVRAVLCHVAVGAHDGYAIVYFAEPVPPLLERFNDWGAQTYTYETALDGERWHGIDEEEQELDFDLARWVDSGELLWVAPGDLDLRLRSTSADCPYLGIEGRRTFALIEGAAPQEPRKRAAKAAVKAPVKAPARRPRAVRPREP